MSGPADVEGETFRTNSIISAMSESAAPSTAFSSVAAMTERTCLDTNGPGSLMQPCHQVESGCQTTANDGKRYQTHTDFAPLCGNSLSRGASVLDLSMRF